MKAARLAGLVAVAAVVASLLSACQPRVGAAAFVGSARISESDVGKYVNRDAQLTTTTDPNTGQVTTSNPKSQVVSFLVANLIFDDAFRQIVHREPTARQLTTAKAAYYASRGETEQQLDAAVVKAGFTTAFVQIYLDANAKFALLATELKDTDGSKTIPAINKLHTKVDVNPRYGTWDSAQLDVSTGPAVPSFLCLKQPCNASAGNDTTS